MICLETEYEIFDDISTDSYSRTLATVYWSIYSNTTATFVES